MIFDIEKWLWKSDLGTFWRPMWTSVKVKSKNYFYFTDFFAKIKPLLTHVCKTPPLRSHYFTSCVLQLGALRFKFFRNAAKIFGNIHNYWYQFSFEVAYNKMSKKNWDFLLITCGILIIHELYEDYFLVFNADFTQCARPSKAVGAISVSMAGNSELCPKIIWAKIWGRRNGRFMTIFSRFSLTT